MTAKRERERGKRLCFFTISVEYKYIYWERIRFCVIDRERIGSIDSETNQNKRREDE